MTKKEMEDKIKELESAVETLKKATMELMERYFVQDEFNGEILSVLHKLEIVQPYTAGGYGQFWN